MSETQGFGTFKGVFTPSILTILGVIMYLRLGWVVGNAGLGGTLLIVTLSCTVTFLTALSIAATATNMRVGIGGAYYMISRSLGLEAGAAVGLPLFLAQALGVSFYVVGFAESVVEVFPGLPLTGIGIVTLLALTALAYASADLALRAQFFILAVIVSSLVSVFLGGPPESGFAAVEAVPDKVPFWAVFAVFFPAVTGIEAGIALSGDLKDPARSLPTGTLGAVIVGFVVYLVIPIVLFSWVPLDVLRTDNLILQKLSVFGPLVMMGLWGATLSSALGALLGAPRTLQALAIDRVVPRFLARTHGPADEPRIATAVTFGIAFLGLLAGNLNSIATVLSMFFLTSYGFLNLSAALEGLIGSPSWRPSFRTPWPVSMAGALLCFAVMLMIDTGATFAAAAVSGLVFYLVGRRRLRAYWGSLSHGLLMMMARFAVYKLAESPPEARTWRPQLLVLSGPPAKRRYLIDFADQVSHHAGFLTVAAVIPESSAAADRILKVEAAMDQWLRRHHIAALAQVHVADDVMDGARSLVQSAGVGPLYPNTILVGRSADSTHRVGYVKLLQLAWQLKRNLVVVREAAESVGDTRSRIVVWWRGHQQNAGLMLALGYLLLHSEVWATAELHIRTIVFDEAQAEPARQRLEEFCQRGRLRAQTEIIVAVRDAVFPTMIERSTDADIVFLGLRSPGEDESEADYASYYQGLVEQTSALQQTVVHVLAAEDIDFQKIWE